MTAYELRSLYLTAWLTVLLLFGGEYRFGSLLGCGDEDDTEDEQEKKGRGD